jgi:hypothetical protein
VRNRTLLIDAALVVVTATAVLVLSPGLAVVAIIAILVLLVCGISFGAGALGGRRRAVRRRRP